MKISKSDALFLYKILYHYSTVFPVESILNDEDKDNIQELINDFRKYLISGDESNDYDNETCEEEEDEEYNDEDDDEEEDSDDEEEESDDNQKDSKKEDIVANQFVTPGTLASLPKFRVVTPAEDSGFLEFEDVGETDSVDLLFEEGSIIIDSITHLKVSENKLSAWDGEEWYDFTFKKLPKKWSEILAKDVIYGIEAGEEE